MKSACGYIRVSTDKQEELSPDAQKRLLIDYAIKNDIFLPDEHIFTENGISGKHADKRPEFQKMIAFAKSKEHPFDIILVWKFSRFARNQEESIVYKSLLKKNNVDVVSVSEPLADGPFGTLIERIIEWMDEYYSIRLSGEVMRGMTEKALRGGYQAQTPYGYISNNDTGIPEIAENEAMVVKKIYKDFMDGKSYLEICRELNPLGIRTRTGNPFEVRTVKYILENPFYAGNVRWNRQKRDDHTIKASSEWIVAKGRHLPLFSEEYFAAVQNRIQTISRPYKSRSPVYTKHWLSSIVKCSSCGASLVAKRANGRVTHFQCGNYFKGSCTESHYITAKRLESAVLDSLAGTFNAGAKILFKRKASENTVEHDTASIIKEKLQKIILKEKRIRQAYIDGIDTLEEYRQNKLSLISEKGNLEKSLNEISKKETGTNEGVSSQAVSVMDLMIDNDTDMILKAGIIRSVVDHIIYDKSSDSLDIYFFTIP